MKKKVAWINFIESLGWWKLDIEIYVKRALEKTAGNQYCSWCCKRKRTSC